MLETRRSLPWLGRRIAICECAVSIYTSIVCGAAPARYRTSVGPGVGRIRTRVRASAASAHARLRGGRAGRCRCLSDKLFGNPLGRSAESFTYTSTGWSKTARVTIKFKCRHMRLQPGECFVSLAKKLACIFELSAVLPRGHATSRLSYLYRLAFCDTENT